jgi:hypothetical protein
MRKLSYFLLFILFLAACKSLKGISEGRAKDLVATQKIIENHYDNIKDFKTLYIRASTKYKDLSQSINFTSDIRIKKNERILVSVRFLGMTMAKGLITPGAVQYYQKSGNKYFEGDYTTLSQWLGTELDFQKVQNLLIGKAFDDLRRSSFKNSIEDKFYKLEQTDLNGTVKSFYFEANNFLIKRQQVEQSSQNRRLLVNYPSHQSYAEAILPMKISIDAFQSNEKTTITLDYSQVTFNEDLSFPYKVPDGYERIFIDNTF